jgi:hypothetical protein
MKVRAWYVAVLAGVAIFAITIYAATHCTDGHFEQVSRVVEIGVYALGLLSLVFLYKQSSDTARWNKSVTYHSLFQNLVTDEMVEKIWGAAARQHFEEQFRTMQPLTTTSVDLLSGTNEQAAQDGRIVKSYLDTFETLCGAVNCGLVNKEYAYSLEATRVIRVYLVFHPLINRMRASDRYTRCYLELERLGDEWKRRRDDEIAKRQKSDGVKQHV